MQKFGLGGMSSGASGTAGFPASTHLLGQVPAALTLAAYALAVLPASAILDDVIREIREIAFMSRDRVTPSDPAPLDGTG